MARLHQDEVVVKLSANILGACVSIIHFKTATPTSTYKFIRYSSIIYSDMYDNVEGRLVSTLCSYSGSHKRTFVETFRIQIEML